MRRAATRRSTRTVPFGDLQFRRVFVAVGGGLGRLVGLGPSLYDIDWPIVLDLHGDGIEITPLTSSNTFLDMAGDGYQHRNRLGRRDAEADVAGPWPPL